MVLSCQALQTNGKLLFNFKILLKLATIFYVIVALGVNACVEGESLNNFNNLFIYKLFFFRLFQSTS